LGVNLRGYVTDVGEVRTVSTGGGERELVEIRFQEGPEAGQTDPAKSTTVTLWGSWTETVDYLEPGMELLVTDAAEDDYGDDERYATTGESFVVVEPDFLVDVTDVRGWVQCPRMYYLNKLTGVPLAYPVVLGTIVHEVFGDLLRGRDLETAIDDRVAEAGLDLGLLGEDAEAVRNDVRQHSSAIQGWLQQGTLTGTDQWRSERTLISETFGIKGRADAVRRGMPVELKTGKNVKREPRFQDKIQAAAYALLLREHDATVEDGAIRAADGGADTGILLYTKNATLDRAEESGDLSPAKEFSIGRGLLEFVVRSRNEIAAMEHDASVPTGYEADAICEYCFEQDVCRVVSGRLDQESKAGQVGAALPNDEREYFDAVYRAVEAERRAAHREYAKLWVQSAIERADADRALIDLERVETRELDGGRWEIRVRRPGGAVSKIREGDMVLASDGHPVRGTAELARVERLGGEEIVLTADEPVDVSRIDVYPSELFVDRMLTALHDALLKGDERRKDVLFERCEPKFDNVEESFIDNNDAQEEAVRSAVAAEDLALIHGPPGTGKTYTIARAVRALVERGERVLLSAFTNRAVDNCIEALEEQDFTDVVRYGTESGVRDDMQAYRLERRGDPAECAAELEDAQVVAATTAACGSRALREMDFDVAVVDEAAQLTEPGTLAAVNLADRFVLVGDHRQLPPVVRSDGDASLPGGENGSDGDADGGDHDHDHDLSRSLFERMNDAYPEASTLLDRQYRMAQRVQAFPSEEFYDGQLRPAGPAVASQRLDDLPGVDESRLPETLQDQVAFIDVRGDEGRHTDTDEAERVAEIVESFSNAGVGLGDVGVIAPYRAQVAEIGKRVPDRVAVDTVDRFQGSAKEVIIVSFVATGDLDGPIFEDHRRMNVAITRARRALVLVGDADALGTDPVYGRMVEWADA
jgi:DNA replication ATP-dependent helicase Dna2